MKSQRVKTITCPFCKNDDQDMIDDVTPGFYFCKVCSKLFTTRPEKEQENQDEH